MLFWGGFYNFFAVFVMKPIMELYLRPNYMGKWRDFFKSKYEKFSAGEESCFAYVKS